MKYYISGKIGDLPFDEVKAKFEKAKEYLINNNCEPVSPIDLPHNHSKSWADYMIEDLVALKECEGIYMLRDWKDSPGAKIEHAFAKRMELEIVYEYVSRKDRRKVKIVKQ